MEAASPANIGKAENVILEDTLLKKSKLTEIIRISTTFILKSLLDNLGMPGVCTRWVLEMLAPH